MNAADSGAVGGYSFPTLKGNRILECLQDLQIPMTEECLINPENHADGVQRVFERLVEATTGVTREGLGQPVFAGLNVLNYAELHDESIPELAFFRACNKMMEMSCVFDFRLKDLLHPNKNRLRRHLSAVINFCKFREERMMVYTALVARKEELLARRTAAAHDKARLEEELAALRRQTAEKAKIVEQEEAECRRVEAEIADRNRQQAEIRHEGSLLKRTANDLKDRLAALALGMEEARIDRDRLMAQIVNSPARIRREMADQQQALEQERLEGSNAEKEAHRIEACVAEVAHAESEVRKTLRAVEEVEAELAKQKAALAEVRNLQGTIADNRGQAVERRTELENLERQLERYKEKVEHVRRQAKLKTQHAAEHIEGLQAELAAAERQRGEAAARLEAADAEAARLEALAQHEARQAEEERRDMVAAYRRMESAVRGHQRQLVEALRAGPLLPPPSHLRSPLPGVVPLVRPSSTAVA